MDEQDPQSENVTPATLRSRALERVRFEQSMGVEFLPRQEEALVAAQATAIPVAVAVPVARAVPAAAIAATPIQASPVPAQRTPAPVADQAASRAATVVGRKPVAALTPQEWGARWQALEIRALGCKACVLHSTRINVVFGAGNRKAKLIFVGEGPGQNEDEQAQPFVGNAGQLLNKIIEAMGLRREEVYICNVVKCRPPGNRTPLPDEVAACSSFLYEQLELVAPKVIVTLGTPAAKALLNTDAGITKLRGRWHTYNDIPLMPTYHPSFVLHQYTDEVRRQVWEDMKLVMAKLKTV